MTIPTGFCQATYVFGGTAAPTGAVCTLGFDHSGSGYDVASVASVLEGQFTFNVMPLLPAQLELVEVRVKFGPDATGPAAIEPSATVGGVATGSSSAQVAWLVQKTTALGGRAGRGRLYLPGLAEADVDESGVITGAARAAMQGAWNTMVAALILQDLVPVLLHGPTSPITTPTVIDNLIVDGTAATQRRRLRR